MNNRIALLECRVMELEKENKRLYEALTLREESLQQLLPKLYRPDEIPSLSASRDKMSNETPVDLVLTVKNTFDYLEPCLKSILSNTDIPFRLFLNDNASTDSRTPGFLRRIRDQHPDRVFLFLQNNDLGVIDAFNFLIAKTTNDVIIVNADTVMPPGWTSRLLWPIRNSGERVASATPFTNAGSYVSFPRINCDSELFEGMSVDSLDEVFRTVKPTIEFAMPAGIGFCMAMSRTAIDEVGLFEPDAFSLGYGMETDWCLRADKAGFRNVLAPNLFVYHKHGATLNQLGTMERVRSMEAGYASTIRRYPNLEYQAHAFKDGPAYQALYSFLLFSASLEAGNGVRVVFSIHDPVVHCVSNIECQNLPVLLIGQDGTTGEYALRFFYKEYRERFTSPNLNWVIKMLYRIKAMSIEVQSLPPTADAEAIIRALERLATHRGITIQYDSMQT